MALMASSPYNNQIFLLPLFLLLLPIYAFAQNNITVGTSLTATQNSSPWLSPSGDFALGFQQLPNQKDLFLLCIWYDKIADKTIVWYANDGDTPSTAPTGSKASLTSDGGLVLTDRQGKELWKPNNIVGDVDKGVMSDEGNFMLQDTSSETLWETFKDPTDTILPSQVLEKGTILSSRRSETNFTRGRFQFRLQQDGNLVLNTINLPTDFANSPYYKSGTDEGTNSSTAGSQLVFNESGSIYVLRKNGERLSLVNGDIFSARDNYIRATLNFDGTFAQYYHPKNTSGSWTYIWSIPDDICQDVRVESGAGVCGYNSICTIKEEQKRPKCDCPRNYSLVDPNDDYGDCKPDFIQGCEEDELFRSKVHDFSDLYGVVEVINTDWPTSDYVQLKPFNGDSCKESCLSDCLCAVAIFRDGTCWKKKLPLSNGRVDNSLDSRGFIKVRKAEYSISPNGSNGLVQEVKEKDQDTLILVGSVLLGTSVFVNFLLGAAICVGFFFIYRKKGKTVLADQNVADMNLRSFTYKELEAATDGFKEELGSGAFGTVYKGKIQTGSSVVVAVAVKRLNFVVQETEKEFRNEVKVIAQTHHKNLVRLLGYCDDGKNRLLVYEYLSNGTLASFVFTDIKPSWRGRTEIALGIAKGLLYLHEECSSQIIHCDIKPQNILLDDYYNAKISDFGLAKLLMMNQSQTHTAIRGTKGYVAPEWFRNMPITAKVDVYSFGVVLLEIICCRRSVDSESNDEGKEILTDWAYDCFVEGALNVLVNWEAEALDDIKKLETYLKVSMWCIQENPALRPTMRKVVQMLEGVVEVHAPPCPYPAYSVTN
ncbi:G-type lectin S-receptor-like serine/threonine-protein kinase RLK1 [Morus notabilis]|uniref:Receptor-like serine/threonine-protein kinase n=1 Tax=Morus notabilis TaxID=981085 RepID=W9QD44_9ROSA|nr:G-type lectin S-receptor-like serine/threonine-protein kinase LECRK3 [Morus notabilis]EXB28985.1 G-type lectin S-receptor-like serine/threonine-protein kinase RLK1 [Morus notabilis]